VLPKKIPGASPVEADVLVVLRRSSHTPPASLFAWRDRSGWHGRLFG